MNLHILRRGLLSGLFALPLLAQAQEDTAPSPFLSSSPASEVDGWTRSLNLGVRGHAFTLDRERAEIPVLVVNLEQQLIRYLSLYGGGHLGMDFNAFGAQVGTRVFFSQTFNEGVFVSAQASYSFFDVDDYTEGNRTSFGGLVGYSHAMGRRWLFSVAAGAQSTRTRTKTEPPPQSNGPPCIILYCKQEVPTLPSTSETEAVEPVVQLATTFRF